MQQQTCPSSIIPASKISDPDNIPETSTQQTPEVGLTSHHWYQLVPVYQGQNQLETNITISDSRERLSLPVTRSKEQQQPPYLPDSIHKQQNKPAKQIRATSKDSTDRTPVTPVY
jgi:hypothetical protein